MAAIAAMVMLPVASDAATPPDGGAVLFRNVTLIPMDRERVVARQSVLTGEGRILAIGPDLRPAEAVTVIDGAGRYLMPGLADMHVHGSTGRDMQVFLAEGVTTVLHMGGASSEFVGQVVPAVNAGRRPGPRIYTALRVDGTPQYGQWVVTTPEEARAIVGLAKTNGYDFIKVYNNLTPEVFAALVAEGRRQGLPVVGHGVTRVGLHSQLSAGQLMVAHLEEYLYAAFFPAGSDPGQAPPPDSAIAPAVAFTRESGAFVTADLATYGAIAEQWGRPDVAARYRLELGFAALDPGQRIAWRLAGYHRRTGTLAARAAFLGRFVKALSDAGVPLIAGTDAPTIPGVYPGASLRADLRALRAAGLTNFQALSTATRNPGAMMARARPQDPCFGVIAVGCRADLLLLRRNPLQDLGALDGRDGVMSAGVWRDAGRASALVDEVAKTYRDATLPAGPDATP